MKKTLLISAICLLAIGKIFAQPAQLALTVSVTPATDCTFPCDGSATVTNVTGGTPPYTYLWNIPLSPQNGPTATGLCPGFSYQLAVYDAGSPFPSQGQQIVTVTCNTASGINNVQAEDKLNIFPNPVAEFLNLEVPVSEGNALVEIHNLVGSVIAEFAVSSSQTFTQVNVSRLPAGVYTVIYTNREKAIRAKFIKQ